MSAIKLKNKTPELKFTLYNASKGPLKVYFGAEEWQDAGFSLKRSKTYSGVTRKYALDKLSFPKEAKKYIEDVEEEQGFEAEILLTVEKWSGTDPIGYYTEFEGVLKLVDKDVDDIIYAVSVIDSSFEDKILNREDVSVIMTKKSPDEKLTSLDGAEFVGFANEGNLITLPSRIDYLTNSMESKRDRGYLNQSPPFDTPICLVFIKQTGIDENVVNENEFKFADAAGAFYINSNPVGTNIEILGSFDFNITVDTELYPVENISVSLYVFDSFNNITNKLVIDRNIDVIDPSVPFGTLFRVYGEINLSEIIPVNNYVQLCVMEDDSIGAINRGVIFDFSLRTQSGFSPQINVDSWLPHEAYSRIITRYTGITIPVYSEYFGRTNSEPRSYTYNGKGAFRAITNGALIRGFPQTSSVGVDDQIAPLSMSLKDKFESDNSIDPIGMGIETIDGQKTVRIEEIDYFYDTRVALFIDNATNVKREYNKDLIYNKIVIGSTKVFPDEVIDGVYDYNNKSESANAIISVQESKSILSKYSFSNASINAARQITKEENPTTDSKYDNTKYVIDTVENQAGNAVSNGNADQGTANWSISSGVSTQNLIGNSKFVLQSREEGGGQVFMSQDLVAITTPVVSFSYAVISSEQLTLTPTVQITARLNTGEYKSLDQNGEWVDDSIAPLPIGSIIGVLSNEFQSMNKFEISGALLDDIQKIVIAFDTDFLTGQLGNNEYIIDDIYVSDSAKYKARTTEGFESITGIVNSSESYNIDFAPGRCLGRRGKLDRAQLEKKLDTYFVFTDSEKNSTLVSKKVGEDFEVAESTDVLVNDLDKPLWTIEKITFNAALTSEQKQDINSTFADGKPKYLGLIAYKKSPNHSAYSYGWLEDYNSGGINGESSFEVRPISKYVSVATDKIAVDDGVILTDSDGNQYTISA